MFAMTLFATSSYQYLQEEISQYADLKRGETDRKIFPDGEHYHRILSVVEGQDVTLLGGTGSEADTLELFDMACGLVQEGARSLQLVIPYLGYATMDRAVKSGEIVKAKTRARLISAIPHGVMANRIYLLDLHAEGIQYYFEGPSRPVHVYAKPVIVEAIRKLGKSDYVLACTDAGRAKWVESLANELKVPASFVFKRRFDDGSTKVTAMQADVAGKRVVIYDDMIRTGGSLLNAAEAYRDAGAEYIAAVTTHGLFPKLPEGEAIERLKSAGTIDELVCTNSHPNGVKVARAHPDFVKLHSIAPILAKALK